MLTKIYKRGLPFSSFRIRGHRIDLRDGGCLEAENVTLAFMNPFGRLILKMSTMKYKKGLPTTGL